LLPQAGTKAGPQKESLSLAATVEEPRKQRTPRVDWAGLLRRTFALDVFACPGCGARRRVLAVLKGPGVKEVWRHQGLPTVPSRREARGGVAALTGRGPRYLGIGRGGWGREASHQGQGVSAQVRSGGCALSQSHAARAPAA
jgi:hypothetical protein